MTKDSSDVLIELISQQDAPAREQLLALNNAHAVETSHLTPDNWRRMIASAFSARCFDHIAGFLIAFDEAATYDSPNYLWFRGRLDRFVYIDRVVVATEQRGRGVARALYEDLFARAFEAGHEHIVCEVNLLPPNPGSDAFHERLGFQELGRATIESRDKTVRYLQRMLTA